jgi:hypothetical protein
MTERNQARLIGHGAVIFFLGLMSGYLFAFRLLEEFRLWPIPWHFALTLPSDERAWRAAHTGNILNGLMLIGGALCLPRVRLSARAEAWVTWGLIVSGWGNFGFYLGAALGATGRGLSVGPNRFGGGDLLSDLTFLVAFPGAILAPLAMLLIARGAFAAAQAARS